MNERLSGDERSLILKIARNKVNTICFFKNSKVKCVYKHKNGTASNLNNSLNYVTCFSSASMPYNQIDSYRLIWLEMQVVLTRFFCFEAKKRVFFHKSRMRLRNSNYGVKG